MDVTFSPVFLVPSPHTRLTHGHLMAREGPVIDEVLAASNEEAKVRDAEVCVFRLGNILVSEMRRE